MKLILASASPRRAEVLKNAGFAFEAVSTNVDESLRAGESPHSYVRRLAESKARAAAAHLSSQALVIGADTTVVIDGLILGKPESAGEAKQMLTRFSGRTHEVLTGVAVIRVPEGDARILEERTRVTFASITQNEIEDYVDSGEPFGKAGGYAIQGLAGRFVTRVDGCYFNVVGLPLARLYRLLREFGWKHAGSPAL
ncbi:MAG: Maf family protein [Candidatus Acidiferrales bacterium]